MRILVHYSHAVRLLMRYWVNNALYNTFQDICILLERFNAQIMHMKLVFNVHCSALIASLLLNHALFSE
jgi:hypothetical protein